MLGGNHTWIHDTFRRSVKRMVVVETKRNADLEQSSRHTTDFVPHLASRRFRFDTQATLADLFTTNPRDTCQEPFDETQFQFPDG